MSSEAKPTFAERHLLQPATLSAREHDAIRELIPGPEPVLSPPRRRGAGVPESVLHVSEPALDGNELAYVTECISSNWISSAGRFVGDFERAFAASVGCQHGIACSSGTAALHLVTAALGLGPGDEVIMPTFTMIATANTVAYTGAAPVLVDAEPDTWNIDPEQVESRITPRTKAIVVVHTYGHPAEMDAILRIAGRHGLAVIEDAAEAHGASYHGRPVGSIGAAGAFSFYGNKMITTGEGGMVTTNDAALAAVARRLRDHAFSQERHFWHEYLGFNYRMTNLQAAVGLAQTERFAELVEHRRRSRVRYDAALAGVRGLILPVERAGVQNVFWMYSILVEPAFGCSRDELRRRLAANGIETRTMFIPIHLQPIYHRAFAGQRFPVADSLCRRGMYLPSGPRVRDADIAYVAGEIVAAQQTA